MAVTYTKLNFSHCAIEGLLAGGLIYASPARLAAPRGLGRRARRRWRWRRGAAVRGAHKVVVLVPVARVHLLVPHPFAHLGSGSVASVHRAARVAR